MTSSIVAGVIAAVIWTVISLSVGFAGGTVALWALVMFVGVTAVSFGIGTVIASTRRSDRP